MVKTLYTLSTDKSSTPEEVAPVSAMDATRIDIARRETTHEITHGSVSIRLLIKERADGSTRYQLLTANDGERFMFINTKPATLRAFAALFNAAADAIDACVPRKDADAAYGGE
jgi:hypothetical protein